MSFLVEIVELITDSMIVAEGISRDVTYSRATDIEPFIRRLEALGIPRGVERCEDGAFCLGDSVLVYAVEPLLTPEGRGLADVAVEQLETHGARIERVDRPHEHVLSIAASTESDWLEARILAARGWVFLISGPAGTDRVALTEILDASIAEIEHPSTR